jgi:hypothetical protein
MANPRDLIDGMHLYTESDRINNVMIALYGASPENLFEGDLVRDDLPTIEDIELVCNSLLGTNEDGEFILDDEISIEDIRGLIVNLVLYDALLDDSLYGQEFHDTYQPRRLLELIQYDDLHSVVINIGYNNGNNGNNGPPHIFHWASERLFPYFLDNLGEEFIRSEADDSVGPHGNTYLHSYLEGSSFRVLNPTFVTYLLGIGFSLSTPNNNGDTPLHLIVYESRNYVDPFPALSKQARKALRMRLAREGNEFALRQYDNRMKRYTRFYETLILLFRHASITDVNAIFRKNDHNNENHHITVGEIIYGADPYYPHNDLQEAFQVAIGRPNAMERARKQKLAEGLAGRFSENESSNQATVPFLHRPIAEAIRNMQGRNLEDARAVIKREREKRHMNHVRWLKGHVHHELPLHITRRKKQAMHNELLLGPSRRKKQAMHNELLLGSRFGGRHTRRAKTKRTQKPHTHKHTSLQWGHFASPHPSPMEMFRH